MRGPSVKGPGIALAWQGVMVPLAQGDSYGDPDCVYPDADGNTNDGYAVCLVRPCCLLSCHICPESLQHLPASKCQVRGKLVWFCRVHSRSGIFYKGCL